MNRKQFSQLALTLLRTAVGWHFLHEGVSKVFIENWSSKAYLMGTSGPLAGFYHRIASSDLLPIVDIANIAGLTLVGLCLFIGFQTRLLSVGGAALLALYYFAYPPFGPRVLVPSDGHLFIVDKLFVEISVLVLFATLKHSGYGIDELLASLRSYRQHSKKDPKPEQTLKMRREVLKNMATFPILGALSWGAAEAKRVYGVDVTSGATLKLEGMSLEELKGKIPKGRIGKHEISRLVMGGNLIGGWAHARDLLYAPQLFKAYNTEKKVFETLQLAEAAGINCINIGFPHNALMAKYKKETGSKIVVISQIGPRGLKRDELSQGKLSEELYGDVDEALGYGADIIQLQGNWCDWLVKDKRYDVVDKILSHIRKQGIVAGMGAHSVESFIECEEQGIIPDYYMKTMHHDNYWSAHPRENRAPFQVDGNRSNDHNQWHDNIFCLFPERTVEFVNRCTVPVMGFKVLAAGAIPPEDGFKWAFDNGADYICVGMFDFQVVKDCNICFDLLSAPLNRTRRWY